jgi:hypothetical protein
MVDQIINIKAIKRNASHKKPEEKVVFKNNNAS